jgi:serine/threonine protein kinase
VCFILLQRDDIKIFDFGLAKELSVRNDGRDDNDNDNEYEYGDHDAVFQLTAMCGTPRYMAPEVALGQPYNETCDVYSFSILCWQILRLRKPYGKKCTFDLLKQVWNDERVRPELPSYWPAGLREILSQAMSANLSKRPTMKALKSALQREFEAVSSSPCDLEDTESTLHRSTTRRRSTHIFKNGRGMGMKTDNTHGGKTGNMSFFGHLGDRSEN